MKEYFSHDYGARSDQALVKLRMKLGMEGLGIYWCIVEMLYENNGRIHLDEIETIAYELRTECERIADVLKNYGLFKFKSDYFYSESVNKRINIRKEKSEKARQSAVTRWNKANKDDANALQSQSERNAIKVNKSKVNKSKDKDNILPPKKAEPDKTDFVDDIIQVWKSAYRGTRGVDYLITNMGKERAAAGKLINLYRTKNPKSTSQETTASLYQFFEAALNIPDQWLYDNMSLPIINSKINEISTILRNGNQRKNSKGGATDADLAEITAKHFGRDYQPL